MTGVAARPKLAFVASAKAVKAKDKALLERVEAVLASGRFESRRAWCLAAGRAPTQLTMMIDRPHGNTSLDVWEDLARAAGVSVSWLARGDGPMQQGARTVEAEASATPSAHARDRFYADYGKPPFRDEQLQEAIASVDLGTFSGKPTDAESLYRMYVTALLEPIARRKGKTVGRVVDLDE